MAKLKKRGQSGAAKNYVTRNSALKKLQVTLADFRRLCILKGIHPRVPRHAKRANKGNAAPATFYYAKDVAYLAHEPVLQTLRAHKSFAKKLSRAIGKREWHSAQGLADRRPLVKLDHIIRERYPTFDDSLRDLDDALSLLFLFANLPAGDRLNHQLVEKSARICAEWQGYVVRAQALRKVFFSIKGVYFQAEVRGQQITWLVPYLFTQHIPSDVDFRVMATFLELYQTLLGFVMFKLYTDLGLVYPPKLESSAEEAGAGPLGVLRLVESSSAVLTPGQGARSSKGATDTDTAGRKVTSKDVKQAIKAVAQEGIAANGAADDTPLEAQADRPASSEEIVADDFVEKPSADGTTSGLVSYASIDASSASNSRTHLFAPYYFYISRECPKAVIEFVLRSFGTAPSHLGWDEVSGPGSSFSSDDDRITHYIVDRPVTSTTSQTQARMAKVQPQWIVDSANAGRILPTQPYAPGASLPPHLSPFVDDAEVKAQGGYVPREAGLDEIAPAENVEAGQEAAQQEAEDDSSDEDDIGGEADEAEDADAGDDDMQHEDSAAAKNKRPALAALLVTPTDEGLLAEAELEAEAAGGDAALEELQNAHADALRAAKKAARGDKAKPASKASGRSAETEETEEARKMSKMLMSNRQRKLYEKLSYTQGVKGEEARKLEEKRKALDKAAKRSARKGESDDSKRSSSTQKKVKWAGAGAS
ncbi:hypothetical protein IE81DRAFT_307967 [Ceraceosorus guamensis]|uniref:Pescadillo homolog n=1 Tax=Ceraceosorus guamensis TaxID=1522189 RepID=A0A316W942_9BASI|nr:hypothetical protein IE81DRAFT_307967 [Ceraceosorus guamensis]PWN46409.1 hypothetical protein IE81DRAFT_307967 [Ceraceosorus guamensis]